MTILAQNHWRVFNDFNSVHETVKTHIFFLTNINLISIFIDKSHFNVIEKMLLSLWDLEFRSYKYKATIYRILSSKNQQQ